jgi:4-alpha-glucanotransferase
LIERGLLTQKECAACDWGGSVSYVDYEKLYDGKRQMLKRAFENWSSEQEPEFSEFEKENSFWLDDYALYMAIKDDNAGACWTEWEEDIRLRKPEALKKAAERLKEQVLFYKFQQYLFASQWKRLKKYANEQGVKIIGDIPIYVAFDSADTWAGPELFQLDEKGMPTGVAGCPPDAFSATGQLWGNPLYRWEYHKETGYSWWMQRIGYCYQLYDVVRIDHFRGFDEYYNIPYGDPTAEFGKWEPGPGYELFKVMKQTIGNKPVIAEDLGYLTPSVLKLVKKTGYPGMKILQFAFDGDETSAYLPHNYVQNSVVYTGTHDNDTTRGWYFSLKPKVRRFVKNYLNIKGTKEVEWAFIRAAISSVSELAIIPIQDYLGLGSEARMNMPSTLGNNWKWRMKKDDLTKELADRIYTLCKTYARVK